jgi:hypothetical protein
MGLGIITDSGRILMARMLLGAGLEGITHCAIGDGDETFSDPLNPPEPTVDQVALKHERARKRYLRRGFLIEDAAGDVVVNGVTYQETAQETDVIGVFFRFDEGDANGITIKEYGFFGGTVAYRDGVVSHYAANGVYDAVTNPDGEVLNAGYLYEVKNIQDFQKLPDTRVELVGVIKL